MNRRNLHFIGGVITCIIIVIYSMVSTSAPHPISQAPHPITQAPHLISQPSKGDIRLLVISDLNSAYGSTEYEPEVSRALDLILSWQPDLVLCGGDMIAGQKNSLSNAQIQQMWQGFDRIVAQPLRDLQMPFAFTIGNHDGSASFNIAESRFTFQRDRDFAQQYWLSHKEDTRLNFVDSTNFPFYYTFTFQDLFFLVWDASNSRISPQQLQWVRGALTSSQAKNAKMRLMIGHLPLYGVAKGRDKPGEVLNNADQLREMLEQYNVHTYISGHHHAYYPAHKGNLQMLHAGVLGQGSRSLISGNVPPMQNVTLIDIDFESPQLTTYTTYNMKDLTTVKLEDLPPSLNTHNGKIFRRDIS
ncbi:MAG: metallophosphoesterase [Cyanobacterium sp. T60_A2020_053]|nr:metallophosphoesterase [Cyanobacterium sp. T60_A2020_053]